MKLISQIKTTFKLLSLFIVFLMVASNAAFAQNSEPPGESSSLEFINPFNQNENDQVKVETRYLDADNTAAAVKEIINETPSPVIVSSDSEAVIQASEQQGKNTVVLRLNELTKKSGDLLSQALVKIKTNARSAYKKDKMGLVIVTYNLGANVITWVHADNMSTFAKTTGVLYMALTTALLSLDKEAWIRAIEPFEARWRKILNVSSNPARVSGAKKAAVAFLSVASLQTLLNAAFLPIIQPERIMNGTFNAVDASLPLLLGMASTAAAFSWYEFFKGIDEKVNPRAKKLARFMINTRSITMSTVASTAMLINFSKFGFEPWIALSIGGVAGLPLFFKADTIANWIQQNPTINKISDTYQDLKNRITGRSEMTCESIFSH